MSNPLKGMMPQQAAGNPMLAQIRQFAGLIGNRDPKQMALKLARQKGITDEQLQQLMQQAREIAGQMGMQ